jgi:Ohr subfamily peroxiredoxin
MGEIYFTKVTAVGGRSGTIHSEDGLLDLDLALPKELGGKGGATNPEQLFAAGYAACFGNAVIHVTRKGLARVRDADIAVTAGVGMLPNGRGGFALTIALEVAIAGVDQATAESIVQQAHEVCPYSNAVRGNVDVVLVARAK